MCFFGAIAHQSSMQELDLLNPQLDPRITYTGGAKMFFGSDGLLRESHGNFVTASEDFTNGIWARNTGVTVSANAAQAPDGTLTADAITYSGAGAAGAFRIYTTVLTTAPAGLLACSSIWLRSDTPITLRLSTNQNTRTYAITSQWQRFDCSFLGNGGVNWQLAIYSAVGDNAPFTVYMWGAQAEKGSQTPGNYIPTSGAVAYEWPVEYDPITLKPLGRSVWEQRTNLMTWSNAFDDTGVWTATQNSTVTPGFGIAPTGAAETFKLTPNTTSAAHYIRRSTGTSTGTQTFSVYARAAGYGYLVLGLSATSAYNACFDLVNGTVVVSPSVDIGTGGVLAANIKHVGNGIYRCSYTQSFSTAFYIAASDVVTTAPARTWAADGVSGVEIFGVQQEAAPFVGPYIPTVGSQVTRVADSPLVADLSTMRYNATQAAMLAVGTCFNTADLGQGTGATGPSGIVMIGNDFNDQASIRRIDTTFRVFRAYAYVRDSGIAATMEGSDNSFAPGVRTKAALALKSGDFALATGGSLANTSTNVVALPTAKLRIGQGYAGSGQQFNGVVEIVRLYPQRNANSELQAMTT